MSPIAEPLPATVAKQGRGELHFRRILIAVSVVAAIGLLLNAGVLAWSRYGNTQPETIVATQVIMLSHDGTLYHDLNRYPYTVSAYMPLFYYLELGLMKLGIPPLVAGRSMSFAALLGLIVLSWRLLLLYTGDVYCAWTGAVLCASTDVITDWGSTGQVDTLAICFAMAAFFQFSRYYLRGERTLIWAGAFIVAALFTKQTMVACPAAIFAMLWLRSPKVALQFAGAVGTIVLSLALIINTALGGRFVADTVFANINPFSIGKFGLHLNFLAVSAGQLVIIAAVGASRGFRGRGLPLFVYLGLAAAVFTVTGMKLGSDGNYQIEITFLLIQCACVALHELNFFPLFFQGKKVWITLLQAPLAIHLLLNFQNEAHTLQKRMIKERMFGLQVAALGPYVADGGRMISTDPDATLHLRGRIEVEPLIYKLLVAGGVIDPEPVRRDIAAGRFSTILLYEDLSQNKAPHPELPTLPPVQIAEMRKHYRLAGQVGGPEIDGLYVYKPLGPGMQ